jgi:ferredoxin-NADP reductase/anaerobic selenocysteine-containing dehydrogenase
MSATRDTSSTVERPGPFAPGATDELPTIEHAGMLEDLLFTPAYLMPAHEAGTPQVGKISCSFCGVGDGCTFERQPVQAEADATKTVAASAGYSSSLTVFKEAIRHTTPTSGCVKLRLSTMRQRAAYDIHTAPSVLDRATGRRRTIGYDEAVARFARDLLAHRASDAKTLIYASGQLDYFTVFAMQEVFRLLGIRNLTGNAEHCLNAGAVHNEILTGQEGPFLTIDQSINGPDRFYLFNGWNGFVTHPPAFKQLTARPDFDAFLIEVAVTESAKAVAKQLGKERVILIRPRADAHLALSVAHEILNAYGWAVDWRFVAKFAVPETFDKFIAMARKPQFAPERVAERIAAEPVYVERTLSAIRMIAQKLADVRMIPINIPSMGLSQTNGVVAHCLWGNVMAMVGKYGLRADGTPAGGTLRIPGQINAESEVQGLSRKYFMGRIPMDGAIDAARRMGLPDAAYDRVVADAPRAALDYSEPTPGTRELFLCFGTQFESNMMGRRRWIEKLKARGNSLIVVDPIPDPFTLENADLIIPTPPHPATTKLYQNGEWKLTVSVPQKKAAPQTRSDATLLYDVMAEIGRIIRNDPALGSAHVDLVAHTKSGYIQKRFWARSKENPEGLTRLDGEVSRAELWTRIQAYMSGGLGPLYCRPDHADGRPISWAELLESGAVYYGGVGVSRFKLDYDDPEAHPYRDIYRRPGKFKFFVPTEDDLELPTGIVMNTGRSSLSDDRDRVAFATATFNSGKATPIVNMPDEHPLYVSAALAEKSGLKTGDRARVKNPGTGHFIELPVEVSDRVKGDNVYVSFHKSRAQMERGVYVNDVTSHETRCAYSGQTRLKATTVRLERVHVDVVKPVEIAPPLDAARAAGPNRDAPAPAQTAPLPPRRRIDTTHIDPMSDLPVWSGQATPLHVTEVIQETHDVFTYRFQGDPLCRFAYLPGQFCSLVLNIDGKKVIRSYSISSTPTRPYVLEITVKRVPGGLVSNWLADTVKVGDEIVVSGPKGKFHLSPGTIPKKLLMLAAGSGITPLMSMSRWLCDVSADVDIVFFNSVRGPADVIFEKELDMMTNRYRMFQPIHLSASREGGRGWTGMIGRISRPVLEMVAPDLSERSGYICGPEGFMTAATKLLTEMKFDMANFHSESFGGLRTATANKALPAHESKSTVPAPAKVEPQPPPPLTLEYSVEFAKSGKTVPAGGKQPLLDLAESHDIEINYGCRSGSCGDCKVKLLSGEVHMDVDDGLSKADRDAGCVLACMAVPRSNCVVDG